MRSIDVTIDDIHFFDAVIPKLKPFTPEQFAEWKLLKMSLATFEREAEPWLYGAAPSSAIQKAIIFLSSHGSSSLPDTILNAADGFINRWQEENYDWEIFTKCSDLVHHCALK